MLTKAIKARLISEVPTNQQCFYFHITKTQKAQIILNIYVFPIENFGLLKQRLQRLVDLFPNQHSILHVHHEDAQDVILHCAFLTCVHVM